MSRTLRYPPFVPGAPRPAFSPPAVEQIPSIDEFLDELPAIEDFLAHDNPVELPEAGYAGDFDSETGDWEQGEEEVDGWAISEWQSYDWSSAAALSRERSESHSGGDTRASESSWRAQRERVRTRPAASPTADEVASALDGIASRIRSGELVIDNLQGTPPEAAMAAALAILLRIRG